MSHPWCHNPHSSQVVMTACYKNRDLVMMMWMTSSDPPLPPSMSQPSSQVVTALYKNKATRDLPAVTKSRSVNEVKRLLITR